MPEKIKLSRCPFCGGKAEIERMGSGRQSMIYSCTDCGVRLETSETFIGPHCSWNKRDVTVSALYGYEAGIAANSRPQRADSAPGERPKKTDDELVEAVPQLPSKRFKGVVNTPHGDASFHSEYEAARDYIWDAVSEKFDRDFPCAFVKVQL